MFNLTVDEAHTFYVGNNGWLVHNGNEIVRVNSLPTIPAGQFKIADRVVTQLAGPRMGGVKLTLNDLQQLFNNPDAQIYRDLKSNNINVIQEVIGKLIGITVAGDYMKIISVFPMQQRQTTNSLAKGIYQVLSKPRG